MREDQGSEGFTKRVISQDITLPEGVTKTGACELLRLLSEALKEIKLPNGDELRITPILRNTEEGQYSLATMLLHFTKP